MVTTIATPATKIEPKLSSVGSSITTIMALTQISQVLVPTQRDARQGTSAIFIVVPAGREELEGGVSDQVRLWSRRAVLHYTRAASSPDKSSAMWISECHGESSALARHTWKSPNCVEPIVGGARGSVDCREREGPRCDCLVVERPERTGAMSFVESSCPYRIDAVVGSKLLG